MNIEAEGDGIAVGTYVQIGNGTFDFLIGVDNTAPPPTESLLITVSETVITETPIETTPPYAETSL